jgi:hypothetical protein
MGGGLVFMVVMVRGRGPRVHTWMAMHRSSRMVAPHAGSSCTQHHRPWLHPPAHSRAGRRRLIVHMHSLPEPPAQPARPWGDGGPRVIRPAPRSGGGCHSRPQHSWSSELPRRCPVDTRVGQWAAWGGQQETGCRAVAVAEAVGGRTGAGTERARFRPCFQGPKQGVDDPKPTFLGP